MPAVLETALDSTCSGSARAIVQQDVFGFDGTRVLIPRGSMLGASLRRDSLRGDERENSSDRNEGAMISDRLPEFLNIDCKMRGIGGGKLGDKDDNII